MKPTDQIKAWGVVKRIEEWAKSPSCQVDVDELCRRLMAGLQPEVAITSPLLPPAKQPTPLSKIPFADRPAEVPKRTRRRKLSRYFGVSKRAGKWYAQIRETRFKVRYLGEHPNEIAAALAYDVEARRLGKPVNFPDPKPSDDAAAR